MKEKTVILVWAISLWGCSSSDYEPRPYQQRVIHHSARPVLVDTTYAGDEPDEDAPPNSPGPSRIQNPRHQVAVGDEEPAEDFRNDPDIKRIDELKGKIKVLKGQIDTEDEETEGLFTQYRVNRERIIKKTTERDARRLYLDKVDEELKQYYTR